MSDFNVLNPYVYLAVNTRESSICLPILKLRWMCNYVICIEYANFSIWLLYFLIAQLNLQTKVKYKFVKLCRLCQRVGQAMPQATNSSILLLLLLLFWVFICYFVILVFIHKNIKSYRDLMPRKPPYPPFFVCVVWHVWPCVTYICIIILKFKFCMFSCQ